MELFNLQTASGLSLGKKVIPLKFKEVLPLGAKEQDLEDLIVTFPTLLNWSDVASIDSPADLLIISRQPGTQTRKRADLFAISSDAELVIIEIKRDAQDENARRAAMEFQAIRYAAASRKMTADAIIDMFAKYLEKKPDDQELEPTSQYRIQAVSKLCEHLADEDEKLDEEDLEDRLDLTKRKQKIYLVAAGYEPDVLSACAWLQEHQIDIACFRLRPYRIADQILLERERLIPPPELDDFFVEMRPSGDGSVAKPPGSIVRQKSDKPSVMKWSDDTETKQSVSSWKDALVEGTKHAIELGLPLDSDALPKHSDNANDFISPRQVKLGLYIETNASSVQIMESLSKMLVDRGKAKGYLQMITKAGKSIDLPAE